MTELRQDYKDKVKAFTHIIDICMKDNARKEEEWKLQAEVVINFVIHFYQVEYFAFFLSFWSVYEIPSPSNSVYFQSLKDCNLKLVKEVNELIEYNQKQKDLLNKTNVIYF